MRRKQGGRVRRLKDVFGHVAQNSCGSASSLPTNCGHFLLLLAYQIECKDLTGAYTAQICTAKNHEAFTLHRHLVVLRHHTMIPARHRQLTDHGYGFPLAQVDIVDTDIVQSSAACVLVNLVISTTVNHQKLMA